VYDRAKTFITRYYIPGECGDEYIYIYMYIYIHTHNNVTIRTIVEIGTLYGAYGVKIHGLEVLN